MSRLLEIGQSGAELDSDTARQLSLLERDVTRADLATRVEEIKGQITEEAGGSDGDE